MEIENPYGHYDPTYTLQPASQLLLERATNTDYFDDSTYQITFVGLPNGNFGYQLKKDGVYLDAKEFDARDGIQFDGLQIDLKGQITAGDVIELKPQRSFSVFDTFQDAQEISKASVSDSSATAELHQITEQFSAAFLHLTKVRTDMGARLNTLDIQESQHEDFKLSLAKSRSNFEDLDYSQAVIDFNENSLALKASQQAFGKVKDLTLFNYI
jgi:flagellar hook-associated protein 3 FlgL